MTLPAQALTTTTSLPRPSPGAVSHYSSRRFLQAFLPYSSNHSARQSLAVGWLRGGTEPGPTRIRARVRDHQMKRPRKLQRPAHLRSGACFTTLCSRFFEARKDIMCGISALYARLARQNGDPGAPNSRTARKCWANRPSRSPGLSRVSCWGCGPDNPFHRPREFTRRT